MKYMKIPSKRVTAFVPFVLGCLAVGLRFTLFRANWPVANGDESIIDLMARHIAYQGERPVFFWGQDYMGTIQAYLGAVMIHLFGSSAFSVRLGTLLIFALYLTSLYFLIRLLYSQAYALFIIALLSIGSDRMIGVPLVANGGYAETMLFSATIFLIVSTLALTPPAQRLPQRRLRLFLYASLGLVLGLALWSDQLVLAAVLTSSVLLWNRCSQEIRGRVVGVFLCGLLVGMIPLLIYNFSVTFEHNSLFSLWGSVFSAGHPRVVPFTEQIAHVFFISLPVATGAPLPALCPTVEPYTQPASSLTALFSSSSPWLCVGIRGGWSLGLCLLWGVALFRIWRGIRWLRSWQRDTAVGVDKQEQWQKCTRLYARLMLLVSGALWLLLFTLSAAAQYTPRSSSRYLICVLLAFPALLWPLWQNICTVWQWIIRRRRLAYTRLLLSALALCVITSTYLLGTEDIIVHQPSYQRSYEQINTLIRTLLDKGATRVYSNYETCNPLMFQSDERITCAVLDDQLQRGANRYLPYWRNVTTAAHPAYLFPIGSPAAKKLMLQMGSNEHYQSVEIAGYLIEYYRAALTRGDGRRCSSLCSDTY